MIISRIIIPLFLIFTLASCSRKSTKLSSSKTTTTQRSKAPKTSKETKTIVEDFDKFYDRFHSDESFQKSRLNWPLEGKMIDHNGQTTWTKDNWNILKVKIYDIDKNTYKTEVKKTNNSFYQKFWLPDSGFAAEYKFALKNGKWYLVFAEDVNL